MTDTGTTTGPFPPGYKNYLDDLPPHLKADRRYWMKITADSIGRHRKILDAQIKGASKIQQGALGKLRGGGPGLGGALAQAYGTNKEQNRGLRTLQAAYFQEHKRIRKALQAYLTGIEKAIPLHAQRMDMLAKLAALEGGGGGGGGRGFGGGGRRGFGGGGGSGGDSGLIEPVEAKYLKTFDLTEDIYRDIYDNLGLREERTLELLTDPNYTNLDLALQDLLAQGMGLQEATVRLRNVALNIPGLQPDDANAMIQMLFATYGVSGVDASTGQAIFNIDDVSNLALPDTNRNATSWITKEGQRDEVIKGRYRSGTLDNKVPLSSEETLRKARVDLLGDDRSSGKGTNASAVAFLIDKLGMRGTGHPSGQEPLNPEDLIRLAATDTDGAQAYLENQQGRIPAIPNSPADGFFKPPSINLFGNIQDALMAKIEEERRAREEAERRAYEEWQAAMAAAAAANEPPPPNPIYTFNPAPGTGTGGTGTGGNRNPLGGLIPGPQPPRRNTTPGGGNTYL